MGSSASAVLAVRGTELLGGVKLRLTVSNDFGMGFTAAEISGCFKRALSRECGVSCFVYAMERGTEQTTTGLTGGSASMDERMVFVLSVLSI